MIPKKHEEHMPDEKYGDLNRQEPRIARNPVVDDTPPVLNGLFKPEAIKRLARKGGEVSLEEFLDSMKDEYKRTV